jgi:hypothetical protein
VRGVGDEPAQALLGLPALGEGTLDPLEHGVQGEPEPSDLGPRVGGLDPAREVAGGDRAGRLAHPLERPQPQVDEPPGERAEPTSTTSVTTTSMDEPTEVSVTSVADKQR